MQWSESPSRHHRLRRMRCQLPSLEPGINTLNVFDHEPKFYFKKIFHVLSRCERNLAKLLPYLPAVYLIAVY